MHFLQIFQRIGEGTVAIDIPLHVEGRLVQLEIAHNLGEGLAPQLALARNALTAFDRQLAGLDHPAIFR
jgi:hypothetical protein